MKTSNVYYDRNKPTSFSESKGSKISSHQEIHKNSPIKKKKRILDEQETLFSSFEDQKGFSKQGFPFLFLGSQKKSILRGTLCSWIGAQSKLSDGDELNIKKWSEGKSEGREVGFYSMLGVKDRTSLVS